MHTVLSFALALILGAPASIPASVPPSAPASAAAPAPASAPAPAPATVAPIDPADTEALVARLALDCDFDPGSAALRPADEGVDTAPNGYVSAFDCEPVSFDQSCVPDPCFDPSVACSAKAGAVCSTCKTKCAPACSDCKTKCAPGDAACATACARKTLACRTRCLEKRDKGQERCSAEYTQCSARAERHWKRNCAAPCDRFHKCSGTCEDPLSAECVAKCKKMPEACWHRCMF